MLAAHILKKLLTVENEREGQIGQSYIFQFENLPGKNV